MPNVQLVSQRSGNVMAVAFVDDGAAIAQQVNAANSKHRPTHEVR